MSPALSLVMVDYKSLPGPGNRHEEECSKDSTEGTKELTKKKS